MSILKLTGKDLSIESIKDFLENSESNVEITDDAYDKLRTSRKIVENIIDEGKTVYGITIGFGLFCDVLISKEKTLDLQANLIRSHCCGMGKPFSEQAVLVKIGRASCRARGARGGE